MSLLEIMACVINIKENVFIANNGLCHKKKFLLEKSQWNIALQVSIAINVKGS